MDNIIRDQPIEEAQISKTFKDIPTQCEMVILPPLDLLKPQTEVPYDTPMESRCEKSIKT